MSSYELHGGTASAWWEPIFNALTSRRSSYAAITVALPWVVALVWGLYYWFVKRPAKVDVEQMAPFVTFYTELTAGATAGFDQKLMKLFHPALLKEGGGVERGLLRAMARCTEAQLGRMTHISRETIVVKRSGMQVTGVALVDFEKVKKVKCRLSWISRIASVKRVQLEAQDRSPYASVSGIQRADMNTFHVTAFNVEPRSRDQLDVLRYLDSSEFESFADMFVERLFATPPSAAVAMMVEPLKEKYTGEGKILALQESVAQVVGKCGGLKDSDVDATLVKCEVKKRAASDGGAKSSVTEIDGIDFDYHVRGGVRNMEVHLRVVFASLRCLIGRYEVRILPDERAQVIVDAETGQSTVV